MQHSRLSFRRVLWYGDGVAAVGELRWPGPRHHGEHSRLTVAPHAVQGHHAQQVLSVLLKQQPGGQHPARLLVDSEAAVTPCRKTHFSSLRLRQRTRED